MTELITVEEENYLLKLTLNRPKKKNALNLAMYTRMTEAILQAQQGTARAILFSGAGSCFTSGNDLADFAKGTMITDPDNPIARFIYTVYQCRLPIVVAVHGVAVGIGTTLLLHSDLVYAHRDATFRLPFATLGLCPEFASSYLLPRLAGHARAAQWLMLGEFFSASDAFEAGLVNQLVDDPIEYALAQAHKLTLQAPKALQTTKALLKAGAKHQVESAIEAEFENFADALKGPEFAEAVSAFFAKRPPDFSSTKG